MDGDVARVLKADDLYEVLMVPRDADAETLRKAKRVMSLATHPDKLNQAVGSNEAFARVTEVRDKQDVLPQRSALSVSKLSGS